MLKALILLHPPSNLHGAFRPRENKGNKTQAGITHWAMSYIPKQGSSYIAKSPLLMFLWLGQSGAGLELCNTVSIYEGLDPKRIPFFMVSFQVSPLLVSTVSAAHRQKKISAIRPPTLYHCSSIYTLIDLHSVIFTNIFVFYFILFCFEVRLHTGVFISTSLSCSTESFYAFFTFFLLPLLSLVYSYGSNASPWMKVSVHTRRVS